jgi:uncharacterized lipoprotein YddW (UPF0748 family)
MKHGKSRNCLFSSMVLTCCLMAGYSFSQTVIVDNSDANCVRSGSWFTGTSATDKYGTNYNYANINNTNETATATWIPTLTLETVYQVDAWYPEGTNRSTGAAYTIVHKNGKETVNIVQTNHGGQWITLGTYHFDSGTTGYVYITNKANNGSVVIADAVRFKVFTRPIYKAGGEMRALWIDAWGIGYKTAAECAATVETARRYNYNVIIPEVRMRGDAWYESGLEPVSSSLDCLSTLIQYAHDTSGGKPYIEVHAWLVANRIWSGSLSAASSTHIVNTHPEWLSLNYTGDTVDGSDYYVDPGHPDANDFNSKVYLDVIRNYDIDGIQFDYIRLNGNDWGYNTTAVARYNAEYGTSGKPAVSNATFSQWRRDNITALVKRVYANAMAIKPNIKVSATSVNWGTTGASCLSDATTNEFQEWPRWMNEHMLDANCPMIYKTSYSYFTNISYFNLQKNAASGRHTYVGLGNYLNPTTMTADQLEFSRSLSDYKGAVFYSYRATNNESVSNTNFYNMVSTSFYSTATHVPSMSWKSAPATGIIKGNVISSVSSPYPFFDGKKVYKARVVYSGPNGTGTTYTDLVGFYALMDVPEGYYNVKAYLPVSSGTYNTSSVAMETNIHVDKGLVTTVTLNANTENLVPDSNPPLVPVELSGFEAITEDSARESLNCNF